MRALIFSVLSFPAR